METLLNERLKYQPKLPTALENILILRAITEPEKPSATPHELREYFPKTLGQPYLQFVEEDGALTNPLKIGVVFSGGQASGGHNVICGIFDTILKINSGSRLYGFLEGPSGIVDQNAIEITEELLASYRNQGGFDLIGSGRTKIETPEQFESALKTVMQLDLDGLVVIGGDDSNTNAAFLAEYFLAHECKTRVVGVPKTIDGDLQSEDIEISFGFDTATKTFSETIGSILRDALSTKKYYFFVKLMGRSASHIALECALQTHANFTFIGEEVAQKGSTLQDLVEQVCTMICKRAEQGKNYGAVLIPEGLIEFIPEFRQMINELNALLLTSESQEIESIQNNLTEPSRLCFEAIPFIVQRQLLLDRDPHGNVQVSKIETERLFVEAVKEELKKRKAAGTYQGKFSAQPLFCGYEGRACLPSDFDCNYCYALGCVAALLINEKKSGYMACVKNLSKPPEEWQIAGIPLTTMIHMEERKGKMKPVIRKTLVDLKGKPFQEFLSQRNAWMTDDSYLYPGPIQFFGPSEITDAITQDLALRKSGS